MAIVSPPEGEWRIVEIDGAIGVEAGGAAVLCQQGKAERRAVTASEGFAPKLRLGTSADGVNVLEFEVGFRRGGDIDRFSNRNGVAIPAQGQHPVGSPAQSARSGSWSWQERRLKGGVSSRSDPADVSGSAPATSFEIAGEFLSPTEATGTWSFQEVAGLGSCWSRAQGSGTWRAVAPTPRRSGTSEAQ
ncbi:MAG: hypothetical protein AAGK22_00730 [Acidobacteriota bacterium]